MGVADLIGDFRQHDITASIHLPLVHLERGSFPRNKCHGQVEHAIRRRLAAGFQPPLIVTGRHPSPFLPVAINVHGIANRPQTGDAPDGGEVFPIKQEQRLGPQTMTAPREGYDLVFVVGQFVALQSADQYLLRAGFESGDGKREGEQRGASIQVDQSNHQSPSFSCRLQLNCDPKFPTLSKGSGANSLPGVA